MLVMSALVFAGIYMVGDPVSMLASPEATEAQRAAISASLGLDLPLWRQYLIFMGQAVRGDFGNSFLTGEPAMHLILERMPATVELACVAMLLSVLIGAWVGLSRRAEWYLEPSFQALRAIPSLAWVPLLLLWLGIDETPKVVLIALGAFFPVYFALLAGIRNVDRKLVEVGRLHRLSAVALTRRILLPAALPSLFTGLRGALSLSWMFLVAAELIAATQGLGYLLSDGRETSRPDLVIAAILLLAVLGKLSDGLLKQLETRALGWRDSFVGAEG